MDTNPDAFLSRRLRLQDGEYTIIGQLKCADKQLFLIEGPKQMIGYDGKCPECHKAHFCYGLNKTYYIPQESLHNLLADAEREGERQRGFKSIAKLNSVKEKVPPRKTPRLGTGHGIEGDSNSCYMDATIFCMFAYSDVFDHLLYAPVDEHLEGLQALLRDNIVHVLRHNSQDSVEREYSRALFSLIDQWSGGSR